MKRYTIISILIFFILNNCASKQIEPTKPVVQVKEFTEEAVQPKKISPKISLDIEGLEKELSNIIDSKQKLNKEREKLWSQGKTDNVTYINGKIKSLENYERLIKDLILLNDRLKDITYDEAISILQKTLEKNTKLYTGDNGIISQVLKGIERDINQIKEAETDKLQKNIGNDKITKELEAIYNNFNSKDYKKVIELYQNLAYKIDFSQIPSEATIYYGIASSFLGNNNKSTLELFDSLIEKGFKDAPLNVQALLGDWYYTQGITDKAIEVYSEIEEDILRESILKEKIRDKIDTIKSAKDDTELKIITQLQKADFLLNVKGDLDNARKLCMETSQFLSIQTNIYPKYQKILNNIMEEIKKSEFKIVQELIKTAKSEARNSSFQEGKDLLLEYLEAHPQTEGKEEIEKTIEEIEKEEEDYKNLIKAKEKVYEDALEEANRHLENHEYKEAIAGYQALLQNEKYKDEAKIKLDEAIDRYVAQKRKEAGLIFTKARNTSDTKVKLELLTQTYLILKELYKSYPNNRYAETLKQNIESVKKEILQINPNFVEPTN